MAKTKTIYACNECGATSIRWVGKCPECEKWNTMVEMLDDIKDIKVRGVSCGDIKVLGDIKHDTTERYYTGIGEFDRVLGGGIVKGCLTLIGGDPGIGKSTLLLQAAGNLSADRNDVLYVSGEESLHQLAIRAKRLDINSTTLNILCETNAEKIIEKAKNIDAKFLIIDSIQTIYREELTSAPGSIAQVRECAGVFMRFAKLSDCSVFLVGHVTKSGSIAGPRVLEHMVDTVLYFEGTSINSYRILRAVKNRFGSTNEIGVFEMSDKGMLEIENPSQALMSQKSEGFPGSVVMITMEGSRPILVEIQALVSQTAFGTPRRQASGIDYNRMVLILAVLEKRSGLQLYDKDVYVNVAGGLRLIEPASDLPLAIAVSSALKNKCIDSDVAVFGEVGLTGEVRSVAHVQQRVNEAYRSGFKRVILPGRSLKGIKTPEGMELIPVERLMQALTAIF